MVQLGHDYTIYAGLLMGKGDRLKAQENLGKATEIFKECGADGRVTIAEKELATLSQQVFTRLSKGHAHAHFHR